MNGTTKQLGVWRFLAFDAYGVLIMGRLHGYANLSPTEAMAQIRVEAHQRQEELAEQYGTFELIESSVCLGASAVPE